MFIFFLFIFFPEGKKGTGDLSALGKLVGSMRKSDITQ